MPESNPLTFPRLVQPILDKHCISCHNAKDGFKIMPDGRYFRPFSNEVPLPGGSKLPDLTAGDWRNGTRKWYMPPEGAPDKVGIEYWYQSYRNLGRYIRGYHAHQFGAEESKPGDSYARVSPLYLHLKKGHKDVKLSADEMHRLVLWMDCNSMFYCATTDLYKQAAGEVVLPEHE